MLWGSHRSLSVRHSLVPTLYNRKPKWISTHTARREQKYYTEQLCWSFTGQWGMQWATGCIYEVCWTHREKCACVYNLWVTQPLLILENAEVKFSSKIRQRWWNWARFNSCKVIWLMIVLCLWTSFQWVFPVWEAWLVPGPSFSHYNLLSLAWPMVSQCLQQAQG